MSPITGILVTACCLAVLWPAPSQSGPCGYSCSCGSCDSSDCGNCCGCGSCDSSDSSDSSNCDCDCCCDSCDDSDCDCDCGSDSCDSSDCCGCNNIDVSNNIFINVSFTGDDNCGSAVTVPDTQANTNVQNPANSSIVT